VLAGLFMHDAEEETEGVAIGSDGVAAGSLLVE
jgi:hypothetical protein